LVDSKTLKENLTVMRTYDCHGKMMASEATHENQKGEIATSVGHHVDWKVAGA